MNGYGCLLSFGMVASLETTPGVQVKSLEFRKDDRIAFVNHAELRRLRSGNSHQVKFCR